MKTQGSTSSPSTNYSPGDAEMLRREVLHLMVDANIISQASVTIMAKKLTCRIGKKVSRGNLAMALSGYRSSSTYIEYLVQLKNVLQETLAGTSLEVVTFYTNRQINQEKRSDSSSGKEAISRSPGGDGINSTYGFRNKILGNQVSLKGENGHVG